jgi:PAS domain S-box-containing protein/diguanylate cyclase (GGDEF)-like protein
MRRADLTGWAPWVFCAGVLVIAALTFALPETVPYALIAFPVLVCAVLGRRSLTLLVSAVTIVTGVLVLAVGQYTDLSPWRRLLVIVLAVAVACAATWTIAAGKRRISEQADLYRLLAENVVDAVISIRPDGTVTWASPSITGILGHSPEALVGRTMSDLLHPSGPEPSTSATPVFVPAHDETQVLILRVKAGGTVRVEATTRALRDNAGDITGFVIAMRDVEEQVRTREALVHEQEFDGLTGLAKRGLALERITEVLTGRPHGNWGLLCVGVNGLTAINHAYTHRGGDAVLTTVGDRLVTAAGAHDRIARIAGDEFVVIQPDITDETSAALAAECLLEAVRGPVLFDQTPIHVTASVGVAMSHGLDAEALLSDTTAAMRDAALLGPDRWAFVQGDVGARTREAMLLQSSLRDALAAGHLVPWFMPVVSLADDSLGGYEALVRWVHEDGSVTMPDDFLPLAEKAGLSADVDRAVFAAVLDRCAATPSHLEFGINISAATLGTPGFSQWMMDEVRGAGVDPSRLHLEVTETALFRVIDATVQEMQAVKAFGLSWWVDDFGTGFSSISHLRDLPIAGLKLDRSFTSDVAVEGSRAARLAEGLAGLAEGLGLSTVAEGVETVEQARALHHLGWMFGQGWHYGKAAPLLAA